MIRNDKGWGMKKITMKERAKDEAVLSWRLTTQKQKKVSQRNKWKGESSNMVAKREEGCTSRKKQHLVLKMAVKS